MNNGNGHPHHNDRYGRPVTQVHGLPSTIQTHSFARPIAIASPHRPMNYNDYNSPPARYNSYNNRYHSGATNSNDVGNVGSGAQHSLSTRSYNNSNSNNYRRTMPSSVGYNQSRYNKYQAQHGAAPSGITMGGTAGTGIGIGTKRPMGDDMNGDGSGAGNRNSRLVPKPKKKKPLSQNVPKREWTLEDAERALEVEKDFSQRTRHHSLMIKFPDPEITRDIVSGFHESIENVHFQQPSTPRFCFVTLKSQVDTEKVISELNGRPFASGVLSVEYKRDRDDDQVLSPGDIDPLTLYVGNLAQEITKDDMEKIFPRKKRIDIGFAKKMKFTRYAFVTFHNVEDCVEAFRKTHSMQVRSKSLIVRFRRLHGTNGMPGEPKVPNPPKPSEPPRTTVVPSTGSTSTASGLSLSTTDNSCDSTDTNNTEDDSLSVGSTTQLSVDLSLVKEEPKSLHCDPLVAPTTEKSDDSSRIYNVDDHTESTRLTVDLSVVKSEPVNDDQISVIHTDQDSRTPNPGSSFISDASSEGRSKTASTTTDNTHTRTPGFNAPLMYDDDEEEDVKPDVFKDSRLQPKDVAGLTLGGLGFHVPMSTTNVDDEIKSEPTEPTANEEDEDIDDEEYDMTNNVDFNMMYGVQNLPGQ